MIIDPEKLQFWVQHELNIPFHVLTFLPSEVYVDIPAFWPGVLSLNVDPRCPNPVGNNELTL